MAETRGALIVCDRCEVATFTKLGEYNSIETPREWHRVHFGTSLQEYNICPECYAELEIVKGAFFAEAAKTRGGIIDRR